MIGYQIANFAKRHRVKVDIRYTPEDVHPWQIVLTSLADRPIGPTFFGDFLGKVFTAAVEWAKTRGEDNVR